MTHDVVVSFPKLDKPEVLPPENRTHNLAVANANRLTTSFHEFMAEVQRLADMSELERLYYLPEIARAHRKTKTEVKAMVRAVVRERDALRVQPDNRDEWHEPVDTAKLLADLVTQIRRYVVLSDDVALTIALWTMFPWVHDIATHSPLLILTSAEAGSGKTTTLDVLERLVPQPHSGVEFTGSSIYRIIEERHPTLLIDEADRLFGRKADLQHIICAGWTRGKKVSRLVRGVTQHFDTWCPKAIGMKGLALPGTVASRAIICKLMPTTLHEHVTDLAFANDDDFVTLRSKLARWSRDNAPVLKGARPVMPPGFNNRLAANWLLLFSIADLAGSSFPEQVRAAAVRLSGRHAQPSPGIRLLAALRVMFAKRDVITSADIVRRLVANPEGDWPTTPRQVSLLLDQYDIHPVVIHPKRTISKRGYKRVQFIDAFARYLPPPAAPTSTRAHRMAKYKTRRTSKRARHLEAAYG